MAIEGKVANILNERVLVINKGSDAGVKEGMKFKVTEMITIVDPDTNEPLGPVIREKVRIKIVEVQTKFSVGKSYETYVEDAIASFMGRVFGARRSPRGLRPGGDLMPTAESGSYVGVGDSVIEIDDDR